METEKTKTKAEMKIEIAQDVIKQIQAKVIVPRCGTYLWYDKTAFEYKNKPLLSEQAQQYIDDISLNCQVCALGSMFLSWVRYHNNITLRDFNWSESSDMRRALNPIFDEHELWVIENNFEGFSDKTKWRRKYPDSDKRLIALMENIVRNNGDFIEDDLRE